MTSNGLIILNYDFRSSLGTSHNKDTLLFTASSYSHRVIVPYFGDLNSFRFTLVSRDEVVINNTTANVDPVSKLVSNNISSAWKTNFSASHIVFMTYRYIRGYHSPNYSYQTFQVVLASDGIDTYVIFNYEDVHLPDVVTGLYLPNVCSKIDFDQDVSSDHMDNGSNINVPGRYMFRLSQRHCPGIVVFLS